MVIFALNSSKDKTMPMRNNARAETPLRKARKAAGLTQYEVCARAGMNQAQLSRLEQRIESCSADTAERLAKIFRRYGLNELHILYPGRFRDFEPTAAARR